jgi:A/G-specific adenine glycosylase
MNKRRFVTQLLDWYQENKRDLPWRSTTDPYKIWLSEILLQQTRVSQGLPYYLTFVKKYSSVKKLASAPESEVLRQWQGLGYYSRARNLHRCAKIISLQFRGGFPKTFDELKSLPGIGDYTAAAIASMAFHQPVAVVDGNVFRVLARLFNIDLNIASPAGKKYFFALANTLIPKDHPGEFNQAIMEFGATHCTPRNPKCDECPFAKLCDAFQSDLVDLLPVKTKLKKRKKRYFNYFVIRSGNKIWMHLRREKDIWQGLNEFFLIESARPLRTSNAFKKFQESSGLKPVFSGERPRVRSIRQILSHQEIFGRFIEMDTTGLSPGSLNNGKFYSLKEIDKIAKPVLITRYLELEKK